VQPALDLAIEVMARGAFVGVCASALGLLVRAQLGVPTGNLCASLSNCNARGRCDALTKTCECYQGYGASTDITSYRAPDCSLRA
jgi:hypothetical protein